MIYLIDYSIMVIPRVYNFKFDIIASINIHMILSSLNINNLGHFAKSQVQ